VTIDDGWTVHNLGDLISLVTAGVDPSELDGVPYVGLEHIESGEVSLRRWADPSKVRSRKTLFQEGDILYGKLRPYLDKAILADRAGICSTDILVFRPKQHVDPFFLVGLLHTKPFIQYAVATSTGVNHPRTSWNALRRYRVPLPPLPEQRAIARVLWTVQRAKEATEQVIAAARELKKSLMRHLLPDPLAYPMRSLAEVADIIMGQSPPGSSYASSGDGVPFLQGAAEFGDEHPTPTKVTTAPRKLVPKDAVLIAVRAPVGKTNIADRDYCIGRGLAAVIATDESDARFIRYWLDETRALLRSQSTGSTFKAIRKRVLEEHLFPDMSVGFQREIATRISTVDRKIAAEEAYRDALATLFDSLLHDLMTAKLRVADSIPEAV